MTIAAMMFSLPMLTGVMKKPSAGKNWTAFGIACGFVILYCYNRIHILYPVKEGKESASHALVLSFLTRQAAELMRRVLPDRPHSKED